MTASYKADRGEIGLSLRKLMISFRWTRQRRGRFSVGIRRPRADLFAALLTTPLNVIVC